MASVDIKQARAAELNEVEGLRGHGDDHPISQRAWPFTDVQQLDEIPDLAGVLSDK